MRILFWLHLTLGLGAALILGMQAITGGLLAYEPAILKTSQPAATADAWSEIEGPARGAVFRRWTLSRADGRLGAQGQLADGRLLSVPGADDGPAAPPALAGFLSTTKEIHRWFGVEGPWREHAKIVTGASAAVLVLLSLSGLILWWPRWRAAPLKAIAVPRGWLRNKGWWRQLHFAFGFWMLAPLLVAALTGVLLAFPSLLAETPGRGARPPRGASPTMEGFPTAAATKLTELHPAWEEMELRPTAKGGWQARVRPAQQAPTFAYDSYELGSNLSPGVIRRYADLDATQRTKAWIRYVHTGEALGIVGQTIALLASFALLMLVWSGVTLSLLRFKPKTNPIRPG
jgi:uncharacterized iron-regulated membrane protein